MKKTKTLYIKEFNDSNIKQISLFSQVQHWVLIYLLKNNEYNDSLSKKSLNIAGKIIYNYRKKHGNFSKFKIAKQVKNGIKNYYST